MREQTKNRRLELQIQPPLASSVQRPFLVAQPKVPEGLSTPLVRDAVRFQEAVKGAPNAVGTARLPQRSYRESTRKQECRIRARTMLALLFVAAMGFAMKLYLVQEILVVLLLLAVSTVTIFILAAAFILFQEGIRRTVLWTKAGVARLVGLRPPDVVSEEPSVVRLPLEASKFALPD